MKLLALLLLTSCGVNGSSNTTYKVQVEGQAEIDHKIIVDFAICNDLKPDDKAVCVDKLLEVLKGLTPTKPAGGI